MTLCGCACHVDESILCACTIDTCPVLNRLYLDARDDNGPKPFSLPICDRCGGIGHTTADHDLLLRPLVLPSLGKCGSCGSERGKPCRPDCSDCGYCEEMAEEHRLHAAACPRCLRPAVPISVLERHRDELRAMAEDIRQDHQPIGSSLGIARQARADAYEDMVRRIERDIEDATRGA